MYSHWSKMISMTINKSPWCLSSLGRLLSYSCIQSGNEMANYDPKTKTYFISNIFRSPPLCTSHLSTSRSSLNSIYIHHDAFFFFFSSSLPHWSDFTWNSYSSQCLFQLFKTGRSVLLSYCINMWTVSSDEIINSWTVGLYHVFLLYFLIIKNSTKNATDTDLMLYIFGTLAPILRRQEGSGIFPTHLSLCSLHFSSMLSIHKGVKFYFILYHLL